MSAYLGFVSNREAATQKNADTYQKELLGKQYKNAKPDIQDMPWGTRDMAISDPFGNKPIFNEKPSTSYYFSITWLNRAGLAQRHQRQ